ncbi:Ig-like domain-containing protein [Hymenobacter rubripertinctus]|uniref:T9SS C-terminal target domain-containing protein n=1 Tax=Hymenobacter rubripertinctus TaxID=2029981 RepID=A0A418R6S5_9BACT|nr:Ig-like domain-containing protein [Hymenobacter rubripertinctus]RIY13280.1 T9SS C-terminal target domain-containing protein [Hymenobacter rubripertinctus]
MPLLLPDSLVARRCGLLVRLTLALLLLLPALGWAQAPSVGQMLNPNGTLRPGARGSFSTTGYQMTRSAQTGGPVFRPTGADDENWQDGFDFPGMDGSITALAVDGEGIVYAGGFFTYAGGTLVSYIAQWDGTRWSPLGAGLGGTVLALAVDDNDHVYAGGRFTTAGGAAANRVARWDGTRWSPLGAGVNDDVFTLTVDAGGNLYAGGKFTTAGTVGANRVAKWDGTAWSGMGVGMNAYVYALAADESGTLYAGGEFTSAGGINVSYVAQWNGTRWSPLGAGVNKAVNALVVDGNGTLYAGGGFTFAGSVSASRLAKWNGSTWNALGSGVNGDVNELAVDESGNVYVGGGFTTAGGAAANCLAKWRGTGWSTLGAGSSSTSVGALAVDGSGRLYANGNFTGAGSRASDRVSSWDGTRWSVLGAGMDNLVSALAVDGSGNVYAAGTFLTAGGTGANRIAKWDGTRWSALGAGLNNAVYALAVDGSGNLYAGGEFTQAGGAAANRVAKWNGTAWSTLGVGVSSTVLALTVDGGGNLYAAGYFTQAGGAAANRVAKWNGTSWSGLGTGMDYLVSTLAADGSGNVYAGGVFTQAGGTLANHIAKWDGTRWNALSSGLNSYVDALAVDGSGNVYAGGVFTRAGSTPVNHVAKWDGTSWSALGAGLDGDAKALAVDGNGRVYVGGLFLRAGGVLVNYIARWDGTSWSPPGTGLNGAVSALASDGRANVYAGGQFTRVGDGSKATAYFGVYQTAGPLPVIQSVGVVNGGTTSTSPLTFTVTFSEAVLGFTAADVVVTNGTVSDFTGTGATYTFRLTPTITGPVTVRVPANGAQNPAGGGNRATARFGFAYTAPATTWTGAVSTDWFAAGNWTGGVPTTNFEVTIPAGAARYPVLGGGTAGARSLTLASGAALTQTGGTLELLEAFRNAGTFSATGGLVALTGSRRQRLGGPGSTVFWNLTVGANRAALTGTAALQRLLTLNGRLATNGQPFTLRSSATATAMVINNGSAAVVGPTTVQRYLDPGRNPGLGYRFFSSPVQAATVGELATAGFTPVVNPAYNTAARPDSVLPLPTVLGYNQDRLYGANPAIPPFERGYFSPAALTDHLVAGRGYLVNIAAPETVALTGTLQNGAVPVGFLTRGVGADVGWHLLGNPYPAPLDWNLVRTSLPTGVQDVVYVFQSDSQYTGTYQFYQNGVGSLPGGLIASMQSFFVRVSQPVPAFSFQNSWRATSYQNPAFSRPAADTRPSVQLDLITAQGTHEPTFVYFEAGATAGFDPRFDADKLPNTTGLNLVSVAATGQALAVNGLPELTGTAVAVPLTADVPAPGSYALAAPSLANVPASTLVELVDNLSGTRYNLRQLPAAGYAFRADARRVAGRFELHVRPNAVLAAGSPALAPQVRAYPNPAHAQLTIARPVGGPASATLLNAVGQVVRTVALPTAETTFSVAGIPKGLYLVRVVVNGQTVTQRLVVE